MEKKINIAELLKDCPQGMKLDCTIYDNVEFEGMSDNKDWPIKISVEGYPEVLNPYGCISYRDYAKCVIFPKGKTTWEGFQRPFKDGDVVFTTESINENSWISIFKRNNRNKMETYADLCIDSNGCYYGHPSNVLGDYKDMTTKRLATEEEKQKLFDAIKTNGYKWNAETKTLEKLFEPKFKVGDRIKNKNSGICDKVIKIFEDCYLVESLDKQATIGFDIQDNWELVPNKFDINTLKPFDKVLCRDGFEDTWTTGFYSHFETKELSSYYVVNGTGSDQCIPYNEETKHLTGTTDDCDEYFKTWED